MKATILPLSLLCLCACVAAQDQNANPNGYPLPTEKDLGPGWQEPQVTGLLQGAPEAEISDQVYVLFTARTESAPKNYAVIVDRYRDEDGLKKAFAALTQTPSEEFEDTPLEGIGDAALFVRHVNGFAANGQPTLWFRRGNSRISISPASRNSSWQQDELLRHLATVLDQHFAAVPSR
jgi:hypothetical protein